MKFKKILLISLLLAILTLGAVSASEDLDNISLMIVSILKRQKEMLKLIDNKLDLDVWKELNHNRIVEDAKKCL